MARDVVDAVATSLGIDAPCRTGRRGAAAARPPGTPVLAGRPPGGRSRRTAAANAELVCECELVTRARLERALDERADSSLDDLRRTTRLGMGPCQGAFCIPRAAAILDAATGRGAAQRRRCAPSSAERFRGTRPIAWGDQLAELWLTAGIFRGDAGRGSACRCAAAAAGPSMPRADVVVIGAGLAGLSCAAELAERGARVFLAAKGMATTHWTHGGLDVAAPAGAQHHARRHRDAGRDRRTTRIARSPPTPMLRLRLTCARHRGRGPGAHRLPGRSAGPDPDRNRRRCRPAAILPSAQAAALEPWGGDGLLLVGFSRYRDAWASYAARNLRTRVVAGRPGRDPGDRGRPPRPRRAPQHRAADRSPGCSTTRRGAGARSPPSPTRSRRARGASACRPSSASSGTPTCTRRPSRRWAVASSRSPSLPPSVPGLRLFEALRRRILASRRRGSRSASTSWTSSATGGRVIAIHTEAASRTLRIGRRRIRPRDRRHRRGRDPRGITTARSTSASSGCRSPPRRASCGSATTRCVRTRSRPPGSRSTPTSRRADAARTFASSARRWPACTTSMSDAATAWRSPARIARQRRWRRSGRWPHDLPRRRGARVPALQHRRLHQVQRVHHGLPGRARDR